MYEHLNKHILRKHILWSDDDSKYLEAWVANLLPELLQSAASKLVSWQVTLLSVKGCNLLILRKSGNGFLMLSFFSKVFLSTTWEGFPWKIRTCLISLWSWEKFNLIPAISGYFPRHDVSSHLHGKRKCKVKFNFFHEIQQHDVNFMNEWTIMATF